MESFLFKTCENVVGYFQKDSDDCVFYRDELFSGQRTFSWTEWQEYVDRGYAGNASRDTVSAELITWLFTLDPKAASRFILELVQNTAPGEYFPRLNRRNVKFHKQVRASASLFDEIRAFNNICASLEELFNYIEPSPLNFTAYGHKVRELLIVACTEVEYLWLRFLEENNYKKNGKTYTTNDYVKIKDILKLNEFEVELPFHRALGTFTPFNSWMSSDPTKSLSWYSDYNAVKHNRGGSFNRGTLLSLIQSVAAIHILLEAQYGIEIFDAPMHSEFTSIFSTLGVPTWLLAERYAPVFIDADIIQWQSTKGYFDVYSS
jgi:hypothetical protein